MMVWERLTSMCRRWVKSCVRMAVLPCLQSGPTTPYGGVQRWEEHLGIGGAQERQTERHRGSCM
jgi:hypothetical protein